MVVDPDRAPSFLTHAIATGPHAVPGTQELLQNLFSKYINAVELLGFILRNLNCVVT